VQLQEPDDVSTFNACDPRWLETTGKLWANSCEAASRKLRRFVSGRAATFLLLGVLTGAGVMTGKGWLGRATGSAGQGCSAKLLLSGIQTVVNPQNRSMLQANLHTVGQDNR